MSAYIVDREHIQYLIDAALTRRITGMRSGPLRYFFERPGTVREATFESLREVWHSVTAANATEAGQLLWDENIKSVRHRYSAEDDSNLPGPVGESFTFKYSDRVLWSDIDPIQVIKAADCLNYQSCEHPGWEASEAKALLWAIREAAIHAIHGYEDAEWGAPKIDSVRRAAYRMARG